MKASQHREIFFFRRMRTGHDREEGRVRTRHDCSLGVWGRVIESERAGMGSDKRGGLRQSLLRVRGGCAIGLCFQSALFRQYS